MIEILYVAVMLFMCSGFFILGYLKGCKRGSMKDYLDGFSIGARYMKHIIEEETNLDLQKIMRGRK